MSTVLLLSTADTDLLAARASEASYRIGNPTRVDVAAGLPALLDGADLAVVRLLGGKRAWEDGLAALKASGIPTVLLGGEAVPDAELMAESTAPAGVVAEALRYLVEGGPENLTELARFLSDTVLLTGEGFEEPRKMPEYGVHGSRTAREGRPTVGVLFYRAHELSGNTAFVDTLCDAIEAQGANALPVYCASLRDADAGLHALLSKADALIATVLAAGGTHASHASAGGDEEAWDIGALADLNVPVLQGLCLTSSRAAWEASDAALSPMDAAMQVAIPEFDGRLITVPFSFKEQGPDEVPVYVADPERAARVAGIAVRHARLGHKPNAEKKLALVFTAYPTKHSRVGNAVGLDTPASAVRVLDALREAGYGVDGYPSGGDELIHRLIEAGGHDVEWLTEDQLAAAPARVPLADYRAWFERLDADLRDAMTEAWGEPPGSLYVDGDDIVLASLRFGNVVVMIQPPRGFGENPIAIYHDPDMPPSHHYMAAYRWLENSFGADAIVHMGKHGTMEWLPGKGLGLGAGCAPDAVLGDLPLIYPFIVNDPGEGTQAKRRGHATVVDHLVPPMARADTYGDLAKLEQLLDEYALVSDLDPAKAPAVRAQIWTLVKAAELHHDLHVDDQPDDDAFDEFVMHIDGYLCEIKDVQIRDGLHILGGGACLAGVGRAGERAAGAAGLPGRALRAGGEGAAGRAGRAGEGAGGADGPGGRPGPYRRRRDRPAGAVVPADRGGDGGARLGDGRERCSRTGGAGHGARRRGGRGALRLRRGRAPAGPYDRRDRAHPAGPGRRLRPGGTVGLAHARSGQRAPDRAELLLRRPEGDSVPAELGGRSVARRLAGPALSAGHGGVSEVRRPDGVGHVRDAHPGRRHRRDPGPAGVPPGVGRRVAPGDRLRGGPAR
jgi:cobaltochelatase CobN